MALVVQPVLPEPEEDTSSLNEEKSKRFHKEEVFEDLPLMDTWNGSDFKKTRRYTGRLQVIQTTLSCGLF